MNNVIMLMILLFLGIDILYGAKIKTVNENFFDLNNSKALRGFWCIVVVLVHVPQMYQNPIQDMIGSFAYIGVTFFFMTSSYGLTLSQIRKPEVINFFWQKRLPKLLVMSWVVKLVFYLIDFLVYKSIDNPIEVFIIRGWVLWLIACYFAFWISNKLFHKTLIWKISTGVLVIVGSLVMYYLKNNGIVTSTTWTTECYGFVWGIVLASVGTLFLRYFSDKWWLKVAISMIVSMVLGITYLKFKWIPFIGDYVLKILLGIAITLFLLIVNTRVSFGNKINMFLGEISFEIYLAHGNVFNLLESVHTWKSSAAFISCSIICTVVISYVIHYMVNSILNFLGIVKKAQKNVV